MGNIQHKKQEQLERIVFFTDAVFAIAITLMAIEIKIPELHEHTDTSALIALAELIPKFIGFLISFFVIGIYWIAHHKIFGFINDFDRRLLWINLILLFLVALLPFSSGFYSEYTILRVPFLFYSINIMLIGFFQARLLQYVYGKHFTHGLTRWMKDYITYRGLSPGLTFLLVGILQFFIPDEWIVYSRMGMFIMVIPFYFIKRYFAAKGVDVKNY